MLAKVYIAEEGLLFSSRIRWMPADRRISPWEIDALMDRAAIDINVADDEALQRFAEMVASMRAGESYGARAWLGRQEDHFVRGVLDLLPDPEDGWLPDLHVRCKDHPTAASNVVERTDLIRLADSA